MIVFKILNCLDLSKGKEIVSNFSAKGEGSEYPEEVHLQPWDKGTVGSILLKKLNIGYPDILNNFSKDF